METLNYEYEAKGSLTRRAHVGVVGSNLDHGFVIGDGVDGDRRCGHLYRDGLTGLTRHRHGDGYGELRDLGGTDQRLRGGAGDAAAGGTDSLDAPTRRVRVRPGAADGFDDRFPDGFEDGFRDGFDDDDDYVEYTLSPAPSSTASPGPTRAAGTATPPPANCTLPPSSPLHFTADCKLLCGPATWTDVLTFFLGNYAAHAATTRLYPNSRLISRHLISILPRLIYRHFHSPRSAAAEPSNSASATTNNSGFPKPSSAC